MAAVVHGQALTTTTNTVGPFTTASFTPAANDLLVAHVSWDGSLGAVTISDSLGGSWSLIATAQKSSGADLMHLFVRDSLVSGAAMTVTIQNASAGTGALLAVARVSGMTRTGSSAVRQHVSHANQGAGTPAVTFSSACLTGNPTIVFFGNTTNPAGITPPASWTERLDHGHSNPVKGQEYASRDSGFTGTTITWGSASATVMAQQGLELDASAAEVTGTATVALALGVNAAGGVEVQGAATAPITLGLNAAGGVDVQATATVPLTLGINATGTVAAAGVNGTATVALALGLNATGQVEVKATGAVPLALGVNATATHPVSGAASVPITLGVQSTASHPVTGTATVALVLGIQAAGDVEGGEPEPEPEPRRATGWRRVLYDPEGAEKAADEGKDRLGPHPEIVPEVRPLPELGPLPAPRITDPTEPIRLTRRVEQAIAEIDDQDELEFILNVLLDLD